MTPFDLKWPKMKFDLSNVFIISNYIYTEIFMTQTYMSHRKRIFRPKFKIWPQMTSFDLTVFRHSMHPKLMSNKQIGNCLWKKKEWTAIWVHGNFPLFYGSDLDIKLFVRYGTDFHIPTPSQNKGSQRLLSFLLSENIAHAHNGSTPKIVILKRAW